MSIYKCCLPNKERHVFGREKVTPWKGRTMKGAVFGTDQHVVVNLQGLIWYPLLRNIYRSFDITSSQLLFSNVLPNYTDI